MSVDTRRVNCNAKRGNSNFYCSMDCHMGHRMQKSRTKTNCGTCRKDLFIYTKIIQESKSGKVFCGQSCAAKYSNSHKTTGTRRSKFENWIENELTKTYPNLKIKYNLIGDIEAELDIYIPSLRLAIEINGVFHYKPIYGESKFIKIQASDKRKISLCAENNIDLLTIDISNWKHFDAREAPTYFAPIKEKIDSLLTT